MWGVPTRNNLFTGREEQLNALHDKLFSENISYGNNLTNQNQNSKNCGIRRTELGGIGGVGKTQLSIEYCHRHFGSKYGFVVMVRAESQASIAQDMKRLAVDLGLLSGREKPNSEKEKKNKIVDNNMNNNMNNNNNDNTDENNTAPIDDNDDDNDNDRDKSKNIFNIDDDEVTEIIKRKLSRCRYRWLIVFDNVEDISTISKYLPRGQLGDQFSLSKSSKFFSSDYTEKNKNDVSSFNQNSIESSETIDLINSRLGDCGQFDNFGGGHVIITSRTSYHNSNNKHTNYNSSFINDKKNNFLDFNSQDVRTTSSSSSLFLECFNKSESLKFLSYSLQLGSNESNNSKILNSLIY